VLKHLQWMRLRGLSDATVYQRALYLRRLAAHLDVDLGDNLLMVDSADLEDWPDTLAGLAPGSRHNAVVNMREFYAWALRSKLLQETPTGGLVLAKLPRRLPRPIAEADLQLAIASAPPRLRLMLVLAAFCGLRAMELAQLDREDITHFLRGDNVEHDFNEDIAHERQRQARLRSLQNEGREKSADLVAEGSVQSGTK